MSEVLKFKLSGLGASFTRPHFNSIVSTYSHIHKVSLLGILGAIIGIEKENYIRGDLPPFYKELKDLKIAIVPTNTLFYSKQMIITDTTGFSNSESTFIGKYDTLINPSWEIYLLESDNPCYEKIKNSLLNKDAHFMPYLGRNHWFADIEDVQVLEGTFIDNCNSIDGLFKENDIETEIEDNFDFEEDEDIEDIYFEEYMPVGFREDGFVQYVEDKLALTNRLVVNSKVKLLSCNNKNLYLL